MKYRIQYKIKVYENPSPFPDELIENITMKIALL